MTFKDKIAVVTGGAQSIKLIALTSLCLAMLLN